jgi:hypothetical protein
MTVNLRATVDKVEDGALQMKLRGGKGNPVVEVWRIFNTWSGIHADRYDAEGRRLSCRDGFESPTKALHSLTDLAWDRHQPDTLTVPPAKVARLLKELP